MTQAPSPQKINNSWLPVCYEVIKRVAENADTFSLTLTPKGEEKLSAAQPGQFNMLYIPGFGEIPVSYSHIDPDSHSLTHTIRAAGAVSTAACARKKHTSLGLRGPFGKGWPVDLCRAKHVIIMAGGLGMAPLKPVVEMLLNGCPNPESIHVLYGSRTPESILFAQDLKRWNNKNDSEVYSTVDHASSDWSGHVGVVTSLLELIDIKPDNTIAMVCGPEIMMHFSVKSLLAVGINKNDIYLSMERNMKCAIKQCGHCQWGEYFVCKDGPVFNYAQIQSRWGVRAL